MDKSKVREVVDANIEPLMERLGIPHWGITTTYDLRESEGQFVTRARCTRRINYDKALIEFDPEQFDDDAPDEVLKTLRHELFHILLSPFDLFCIAAEELWADDPVKKGVFDTIWQHAQEQGVINLERMYRGLTKRQPLAIEGPAAPATTTSPST